MSSTAVQLCLLLHVQDHSAGLRLGRDGFSDRSQQARSSSGPTPVSPLRLGGPKPQRDHVLVEARSSVGRKGPGGGGGQGPGRRP